MALNFPHREDIQLGNAPLDEVICQVRFPIILRISKDEPSEFQEEIRNQFPQVEVEHGVLLRLPGSSETLTAETQPKIYRFRTQDDKSTISLAPDFYALSTNWYTHWTDFAGCLSMVGEVMNKVYKPAFATRVGLRYINRLTSKNTGLQSLAEISGVLNQELSASTRSDVWDKPLRMQYHLLLADGEARLSFRTEYGADENYQPYFVLDFDYFEEGQLPLADLVERCTRYHDVIYDAFRWCIPDDHLGVFNPVTKGV